MPAPSSQSQHAADVSQHIGLVNLGNTCFLNSILQLSSSTRALHALLHPAGDLALPEAATSHGLATASLGCRSLNRRKIPALLLADEDTRRPIMPPLADEQADALTQFLQLSSSFRYTLDKTWREMNQQGQGSVHGKVTTVSPKQLLKLLASKFDQFGDYEQQDAHELLRLLLDAMRMEEMDFIKKMRPSKTAARLTSSSVGSLTASITSLSAASQSCDEGVAETAKPNQATFSTSARTLPLQGPPSGEQTPTTSAIQPLPTEINGRDRRLSGLAESFASSPNSVAEDHLWEDMSSLVDVLWGGRLASMVVCEGCRHVSHTYEDFLDLSLPLRPEDASSSLKDRRTNRIRLMADRWRKSTNTSANVSRGKTPTANEARDTILKGTIEGQSVGPGGVAPEVMPIAVAEGTEKTDKRKHPSKRHNGAASADEGDAPSGSNWSSWAASLGRSRSARPTISGSQGAREETAEVEAIDMPDVASLALSPRPATAQLLPEVTPEHALANGLNATLEAKSRRSRDLLSALSNASRANSRAGSRAGSRGKEGLLSRSNSPGMDRIASPLLSTGRPHQGSQHHFHSHGRAKKEPSKQANYISRVFGDPEPSKSTATSSSSDPHRAKVRAAQASTGLVTALRAFTTAEVLSDDNAFHCKRCWRRLNPVKGIEQERLRRRRLRKGKDASGSEDSDDDEEEAEDAEQSMSDLPARAGVSTGPFSIIAPQPKRAVDTLLGSTSDVATDDESSDTELPSLTGEFSKPSTIDMLEDGVRTPISRTASAQPSPILEEDEHPSRRPSLATDVAGDSTDPELVQRDFAAQPQKDAAPPPETLSIPKIQMTTPESPDDPRSPDSAMIRSPVLSRVREAQETTPQPADGNARSAPAAGPSHDTSMTTGNGFSKSSTTEPGVTSSRDSLSSSDPQLHSSLIGDETDASMGSQTNTNGASRPPAALVGETSSANGGAAGSAAGHQRAKRSTQSVPRRALKRYLISEFPPILVFHLKRFQASAPSTTTSANFFSSVANGAFKKIDDVVTYPEWLDMSEWMAPPREEYDRYGRLKESSDPRVLEAYRREMAEAAAAAESYKSSLSGIESGSEISANGTSFEGVNTSGDGDLAGASAPPAERLKRKPSRWSRHFGRGPSTPVPPNEGSSTAAPTALAPGQSPSHSRVSSPALPSGQFASAAQVLDVNHSEDVKDGHSPGAESAPRSISDALPSATHTSGGEDASAQAAPLYRLYGVVAHHGSTMHGGHYTSYALSDRVDGGGGAEAVKSKGPASSNANSQPIQRKRVDSRGSGGSSDRSAQSAKGEGSATSAKDPLIGNKNGQTHAPAGGADFLLPPEDNELHQTSTLPLPTPGGGGAAPTQDAGSAATHLNGRARSHSQSAGPALAAISHSTHGRADRRRWVYCSDTVVCSATLDQVLKCKDAYLLWYERVA